MAFQIVESNVSAAIGHNRLLEESKDEHETYGQLLPGIPNEISVDVIAAKFLSWKEICTLSCVSPGWCHAARNREVYRARVRLKSTEKLFFHESIRPLTGILRLRSKSNNSFYEVPPIPGHGSLSGGRPLGSKLVPIDGRTFIIGGQGKTNSACFSNEVYVLDLAGRKQWKPCASMREGRGNFGCSVLDGKIYVFGGLCFGKETAVRNFQPVCGSEVYDPKQNTWKSIKASTHWRYGQQVVAIERELVIHSGYQVGRVLGWDGLTWKYIPSTASYLEAYNPDKDDWRVPSESSDSRARQSTTFADLLKICELAKIKTRLAHLSV